MKFVSVILSLFVSSAVLAQNYEPTYQINPNPKATIHPTGLKMPKDWYKHATFVKQPKLKAALPASFDWRKAPGGISTVRDQGNCGSCWAFSIAATFSDHLTLAEHKTTQLSEQYLLSCNKLKYDCENGGFFDATDMYVDPGAVADKDLPYTATDGKCPDSLKYAAQEKSWNYIGGDPNASTYTVPSVEDLKTAIYLHGPISVAVNATSAMQFYFGGVFNNCTATTANDINHAVNIVGWDDATGSWIMRNSWGSRWGEKGYIRIKYGCNMIGYAANYITYAKPLPTPPKHK